MAIYQQHRNNDSSSDFQELIDRIEMIAFPTQFIQCINCHLNDGRSISLHVNTDMDDIETIEHEIAAILDEMSAVGNLDRVEYIVDFSKVEEQVNKDADELLSIFSE